MRILFPLFFGHEERTVKNSVQNYQFKSEDRHFENRKASQHMFKLLLRQIDFLNDCPSALITNWGGLLRSAQKAIPRNTAFSQGIETTNKQLSSVQVDTQAV
jgi:hypothetical protein